jgi:Na+-driven multidrug efflux pump
MGVAGAAWATVIARGVFALFGLYLITLPTAPVRLVLRRPRPRPRMLWNLTRIGIPSSLQYVVRVIAYGAILRLVTRFGESQEVHAALAVGFRLDLLAMFTGVGWGAAAAAMVGQALGAGKPVRAERAGWWAALLDAGTMGLAGLLYYVHAPWLMEFFGEDPLVRPEFARMNEIGVEYLRIAVWGYGAAGVAVTLAHALNGAGSTKTPLTLDALGFLAFQLPLAAFVTSHLRDGYDRTTLWGTLVAVNVLVAALYAAVWARGHWKHKRIQ